jgi:small subunit ribosomal protein S6
MQKNYELLYIVHPDLEGSTDKVTDKVTGFITKTGGEVTSQEDWGKRKLAYPIAKNAFGVYVLLNFKIEPTKLHEVERDLRLSEEIMRSMIVVVPDIKELAVKPKKEKTEAKVEKAEEPASIIISGKKPAKVKKEKVEKEAKEKKTSIVNKKEPAKKAALKKSVKTSEKDEAERLKKLDEKLDELLK